MPDTLIIRVFDIGPVAGSAGNWSSGAVAVCPHECVDDDIVEMNARATPQLIHRLVRRTWIPVGPVGSHGIEGVYHGDNACFEGNLVALE